MSYQSILAAHVAGNPPGADPKRSYETQEVYNARMAALSLAPDINVGESDGDYELRLATYATTPPLSRDWVSGAKVSGAVATATLATSATSATTAVSASFATSASYAP